MSRPSARMTRANVAETMVAGIEFVDENARIAWEIGQTVSKLIQMFPPESASMEAVPIHFAPEHEKKGVYAIFFVGTVVGTPELGVYVVPSRTLEILNKLAIHYCRV